jgi:O-antigen ligase
MKNVETPSFYMPVWVVVFAFVLFGPLMAMGPRFTPGIIVYGTVALLPLLFQHWREIPKFYVQPAGGMLLAALLYSIISVAWSPSRRAADMGIDLAYLTICGALVAGAFYFTPKNIKPAIVLFFSTSLIAGFGFLLVEMLFDHPIHRAFNGVPSGAPLSSSIDKRLISLFSLGIWPLAAWLEFSKKRLWAIGAITAFLCLALYSSSRAAALGLVCGIVTLFIAGYGPRVTRWVLMAVIAAGITLTLPALYIAKDLPPQVVDKLFSSAQHRVEIWTMTLPHVLEKPIFGHGIDASRGIKTEVAQATPYIPAGENVISQHPHNVFLQLWLDFGAIGAVLWGGLMLMLAHAIGKMPRDIQPYALSAAFCSLALLCTSYSPLQAWWLAMHITTALILTLIAQSDPKDVRDMNGEFLSRVKAKALRQGKRT